MLAELFNAIVGVSQKAKSHEVKLSPYPNDPDRQILFTDDKYEVLATPRTPPDPKSVVETIGDFARAYIKRFGDAVTPEAAPVWFDTISAVFFLDEPHRRQSVRIKLELSEVWQTVIKFDEPQIIGQAALVRLLRHDLMECGVSRELEAFRSIKFENYQGAARNIQNSSMDADLVVKSNTGDEKPAELRLSVRPYLSDALREQVLLSLLVTIDIDTQKQLFTLQLAPNSVRSGLLVMQETVRKLLTRELPEGTIILAGTP